MMKSIIRCLLLFMLFCIIAPANAYVILHDRHDEFMNVIHEKGIRNSISVAWGSSLIDMKSADKMSSEDEVMNNDGSVLEQGFGNKSIRTYSFIDLEYSLSNSRWFGFALGAAQSFAQMKKDKAEKAVRYSDYYFGKCVDIMTTHGGDYAGALGVSIEAERFRDRKNIEYTLVDYTPVRSETMIVRKRDATFSMVDACIYADGAATSIFHILSFRTGIGYMDNDKLNSLFNKATNRYDYYDTSANAWYLKWGVTAGLRATILYAMFDLDCRTSLAGNISDKNSDDTSLGYGGLAIVSPTAMVNKNFFKASRGALEVGLDFNVFKLAVSGGVEYVNLHYVLKDNRYETTSFVKVDAKVAATASW